MDKIINTLFSDYLAEQTVAKHPDFILLSKAALQQERKLRSMLTEEQTRCFEELFELTSQIHFLEVKDAFASACKIGAKASKELTI